MTSRCASDRGTGLARRRNRWLPLALLALATVSAAMPALAQNAWGRRGFTWQPEIQLAKEEMARLQVGLDRLSREEWRARSLAWLEVESPEPNRVVVTESWRVADLAFRKRAQVNPLDNLAMPSSWEVVFEKKPQRTVAVVMTDTGSTRVACPLGGALEGGGALGVFQHQGVLVCVARAAKASEAAPEAD